MDETLKAMAMALFGFGFYKLITWWTNAPFVVAIIASVAVIFVMRLVAQKVKLSKQGNTEE